MTQPSTRLGMPLNSTDRQILAMVGQGHTNARMGRKLNKTEPSIRGHIQRAMTKLGARSRAHAVVLSIVSGDLVVTKDGVIPRA